MSTIDWTTGYHGLAELAKVLDPSGKALQYAKVLSRKIPMFDDAYWRAASHQMHDIVVREASRASASFIGVNEGYTRTKGNEDAVTEQMGIYATLHDFDTELEGVLGSAFMTRRMQRRDSTIRSMAQGMVTEMLYGNVATNPKGISGFATRMNAHNGYNIIDNGGSAPGLTSIYVITWGPEAASLIVPPDDATIGVQHTDHGKVWTETSDGNPILVWRDLFRAVWGISITDPRSCGRICNIEPSGAANTFDEDKIIQLLNWMEVQGDMANGRTVMYMNNTLKTFAEIRAKSMNNTLFNVSAGESALDGTPLVRFRGIPIRAMSNEILLDTESAVAAA